MLSRRQFLYLVASGVAPNALLPLCEPALHAELLALQDSEVHLKKRYIPPVKTYGSGSFGEWIDDSQGLPCYHYTCDQTQDPAAITPVEPGWRATTDQTHQIGNDRIIAAASNYGYIQVRQDEGGPKFLNDYHPEEGLFGAGIGYLSDGKEALGTYFPGNGTTFDRFFGMGYLRKQIIGTNFSVDQTIYAPFGDDPVLISEVVITSQNPTAANLHWGEYWGCQSYPFAFDAYVDGHIAGPAGPVNPDQVVKLRRDSAARFEHRFERIPGIAGLTESKHLPARPQPQTDVARQEETASSSAMLLDTPGSRRANRPQPSDNLPPLTFLASLDEGPVTFLTNAANFFGSPATLRHTGPAGSVSVPVPNALLHPDGMSKFSPGNGIPEKLLPDDLSATGPESALILLKPFILEPGQSRTLRFLYGYIPEGFTAASLIAKYRASAEGLFARNCAAWKDEGIQLAIKDDPWVERETHWHNYYLRSGFTCDDFFKQHIISQGQVYQYCIGFQGAARDPLQHALPLVFGQAALVKEVLRYTLKSQAADGGLPFFLTGHGTPANGEQQPSDLDLWLLWLASEYVLATRDAAFLGERLPTWPLPPGGPTLTVREMLRRSYRHLVETIGTGKHGLLRGGNADWNNQIYRQGVPGSLIDEVRRESESMMNAAMAAYVLDHYARMLRYAAGVGDAAAREAADRAEQQRTAVREQWAGKWFKRAWLGPAKGWLGAEDRMWLDGQPWAILGGCASAEQGKALARSIDELLRKPSKIGAKQVGNPAGSKPLDWPGFMPGESENGGVWAALDGPLVWALAGIDGNMAYDEWTKTSRAHHAEVYPDVWYGIWSGPDVYCSSDSDHAGQTGYDWGLTDPEYRRRPNSYRGLSWTAWPVMNMHRHAWPLYSAAKLLGIEFTEKGIDLTPSIPKAEYSFRSKLVGLEKSAKGYHGWYAPQNAGSWILRFKPSTEESSWLKNLTVNETAQPLTTQPDGTIQFLGTSTPDRPLRWSLFRD